MFELNNTNPNQSLTSSANPASTNILNSQVMPAVYQDLQRFAADPNLNEKLKLSFGSDYNVQTAQTILDNWLIGDFSTLPPIELVERGDIAGANGAFAAATNKIYLSKDILTGELTNTEAIKDVIVEEIGHSIDAQVNAVDAPGDEGAIFAATVQGKVLSSEELSALKAEDDSAVVIMGGKPIVIEQNTMSNPETINNSTGYFTGRQLYSSQSVSTNNDKYYRFTIGQSAGRLSVGLKDIYGSADVSMIRDANNNGRVDSGEVLASSEGSSNKLISGNQLDNLSAGTYYLRVKGNASYGIAVNLDQAGNSASEGNTGGFSINKARNLGTLSDIAPSQDYQLSDFVGSGLGDPVDYYSFQLDKPRSLSFALRNMTGNANVYIEDGKGTLLAQSENTGSADELSSVNLAGKTTYYVHVAPFGSESTNYRLVLNPGAEIPASSNTPLLTPQGAQYFKDRPQFYMPQGNGYASSGLGSSVLGNNYPYGQEGNCTWYAYGRLKELGFNPGDILSNPVTLQDSNAFQWGNVLGNGAKILSSAETPKLGDVAQWLRKDPKNTKDNGHVAIVEKVENGYVWLSESNWTTDKDGDKDGDGKTKDDGTLHWIVQYTVNSPNRYIRLTRS